jgi:mannose-6-phosphate isomerase-like protein (cupin superfamily)
MESKVNINSQLSNISTYFSPKIIGEVNDVFIKLAKVKGQDVPWHIHDQEDELFFILNESLTMEIINENPFELTRGELFIVRKGIEHRVHSEDECSLMLIENKSTSHTGKVQSHITKSIEDQK